MNKIAVLIQTYNEEKNIAGAIASAHLLTLSVYVADTSSDDSTVLVAKKLGATVLQQTTTEKYVEQTREDAIHGTDAEWIFILDADERVTQKLASIINETIHTSTETYFQIPRKNIFAKRKWLKHGGWWPDYQIRLFKKSSLIEWPKRIHSTPRFSGVMGRIDEPFLHYFHPSLENMVTKTAQYETVEAQLLADAGRKITGKTVIRKYCGELYRRLIKRRGIFDGMYGIIESMYQAYSKAITWLITYELQKKS